MEETFKSDLEQIRMFLSEKRKLTELGKRVGVSTRLVHKVFLAEKFSDLTGKKLSVYEEAIRMAQELKRLPLIAKELFS